LITVLYNILRKQRFAQNCGMHQNCNPYLQNKCFNHAYFWGTVEWLDKNQIRLCEDTLRFWISRFRLVTSVQLDITSALHILSLPFNYQLPTIGSLSGFVLGFHFLKPCALIVGSQELVSMNIRKKKRHLRDRNQ